MELQEAIRVFLHVLRCSINEIERAVLVGLREITRYQIGLCIEGPWFPLCVIIMVMIILALSFRPNRKLKTQKQSQNTSGYENKTHIAECSDINPYIFT